MRTFTSILVATLAAFVLAFPAQAAAAPCYTTSPAHPVKDYYVAIDANNDVWIYQETNGLAGLQRDDANVNDVHKCIDGTVADKLVF